MIVPNGNKRPRKEIIMELKNKKINFLGDSITEGTGCSAEDKIYLNLMKERCSLAAARNYGWGGTRIARQSDDVPENPRAYCDRYMLMDDDADIIVVFGGTNDFGHGDAKIGCNRDRIPTSYYGAWHILLEGLINKYPGKEIVIMTPVHRGDGQLLSRNNEPLSRYVEIIKEIAAQYAIPVLDLYACSGIAPEIEINKKLLCPDGLHPNDLGHERIYSRLVGFLKSL